MTKQNAVFYGANRQFMRHLLLFLLMVLSGLLHAQSKIQGRITNTRLEPLALVSVQLKGDKTGTISSDDGRYTLEADAGKYDVVFTMIGYQPQILTVVVGKEPYTLNVIMEEEKGALSEVVVKGKARDRSEEFIRNVIRHKDAITDASGPYSCDLYIRATQEDSLLRAPKKKPDTLNHAALEFANMAMAEIALHLDHLSTRQIKEERVGVKKRGNPESLFFLSTTEGNFDIYQNLIKVPSLASIPFLSPVSYSGLVAYRFRLLRTVQVNRRKEYTIAIIPKQVSNATVEGELIIEDSTWVVKSCTLRFPSYHLPEYDFFQVHEVYQEMEPGIWMINQQEFNYFTKSNRAKKNGHTLVSYSNYKFHQDFKPGDFGSEISATTQRAYDQDSSFWQITRTAPLTEKEVRFIQFKDSVFRATHTMAYLDSIDRKTNQITAKKLLLTGQSFNDHVKQRRWAFPPITSVYQPFQFGGTRIYLMASYWKTYESHKNLSVFFDPSYGIRNHDLNGGIRISRMYNPYNRGFYSINVRKNFEPIYSGDAWINLIKRSNVYLNHSIGLQHGLELVNGLYLFTYADLAIRKSVSGFKVNPKVDSILGGILDDNQPVAFAGYNAFYGKVRLQYTPFQKYIREPKEKIILGSTWPTFYISYRRGTPGIFNSKIDFSYLEEGIEQSISLGLMGTSTYTFRTGSFLSRKDLRLVDYHWQRRGDPILFMNPQEAFQALDSTFPVFKRFYQFHYLHEFNGALINHIPIFKKLRLKEIAGGGFLDAPERNLRYIEAFAGVERVFKWPFNPESRFKLGVYVVGSAANKFSNPVQFKLGVTTWDKVKNKWY